jgi:hypothetical protein
VNTKKPTKEEEEEEEEKKKKKKLKENSCALQIGLHGPVLWKQK